MSELKVECYAGYKGAQYPRRFTMGEKTLEVEAVEDQWYGLSAQYFRVRANDGNLYVLRQDQDRDRWSLDAFRRQ
jgi:hypothetical protein